MRMITHQDSQTAWRSFEAQWHSIYQLKVSEVLRERAIQIVWEYHLRGYDAMHLAAAHIWRESLNEEIIFGTFDMALWMAGKKSGMTVWPEDLETFFSSHQ
ncbi:MAG: type II toxin-antitoxin system VapC family toxin, partial [Chloroflexota bacterium]|nr:type II toxin-antitoxin system VapC family toxin [Chloroflexota bacterium]